MNSNDLILSYYDSGYYWTIYYDGKKYCRDCEYDEEIPPYPFWDILKAYEKLPEDEFILYIRLYYKKIKKIIICNCGDIEIYEK